MGGCAHKPSVGPPLISKDTIFCIRQRNASKLIDWDVLEKDSEDPQFNSSFKFKPIHIKLD